MGPTLADVLVKVYFNTNSGKGIKNPKRFIQQINGTILCGVAAYLWVILKTLESGIQDPKINAQTLNAEMLGG